MFKNMNYQYKIFFSFSFLIFIILMISAIAFHQYGSILIQSNIETSQTYVTKSSKEKIDQVLSNMNDLTKKVHSSSAVMDIMRNISDSPDNYFDFHTRENQDIKDLMYSLAITEDFSGRLNIISRYYDYTYISNSYNSINIDKDNIRDIERIKKMLATKAYYVFSAPHKNLFSSTPDKLLTVSRPLRDNYTTYGIVEYSRPLEDIDLLFEGSDPDDNYHIVLINSKGEIIYENLSETIDIDTSDLYNPIINTQDSGMYNWTNHGKTFSVCFSKLDQVDWTILNLENLDTHQATFLQMQRIIILSYLAAFIAIIIFIYFFSSSFTKPLKSLINSTNSFISKGGLNLSNSINNNEIIILGNAIEDMFNKIQMQNNLVIQSKESETKAYLEVLQAQLNPHFLYNTLAVIGAYGQSTDNLIVADMCNELSDLLRYTISYSNEKVTMEDEIANIQGYLYLMKMRYQHFLEYDISFDESIYDVLVPKLILQPIVENCFKHGFKDINPTWKIKVTYFQEDGYWILKIQDNGTGFSEETITQIYNRFEILKNSINAGSISMHIQPEGLGLINTLLRLYLFFNGEEEFYILNEDDMNTIIIKAPLNYSSN